MGLQLWINHSHALLPRRIARHLLLFAISRRRARSLPRYLQYVLHEPQPSFAAQPAFVASRGASVVHLQPLRLPGRFQLVQQLGSRLRLVAGQRLLLRHDTQRHADAQLVPPDVRPDLLRQPRSLAAGGVLPSGRQRLLRLHPGGMEQPVFALLALDVHNCLQLLPRIVPDVPAGATAVGACGWHG